MSDKATEFLDLIKKAVSAEIFKKCTVSKLADKSVLKAVLTQKTHKEDLLYVIETYHSDGKKIQKNYRALPQQELCLLLDSSNQTNLIFCGGECEMKTSKRGAYTILHKNKLENALKAGEKATAQSLEHKKQYILRGDEPFLYELDITDKNGRIKDKRQAKFRQICRFLEYVRDIVPSMPDEEVVIYDLCCGKSYLSFAVYHYFKNVLARDVSMLCVDLKEDVMRFCQEISKKLGFDKMEFRCADITKLDAKNRPNLVLSLHACDIATDLVLENAVRLGADVILSTPCCHRDLSRKIDCAPLSFATRHSILKSKLCDALTDSMRLVYLEKEGYRVDACELVDPEDTPKNVILRAIKKKNFNKNGEDAKKKAAEYDSIRNFLGIC